MNDALTLRRAARIIRCDLESPPVQYLLSLAPSSRETQAYGLRAAAKAFGIELAAVDWPRVTPAQMVALRSHLAAQYAPSTANRVLSAVTSVLEVCVDNRLMSRDDFARLKQRAIPGRRELAGRAVPSDELERIFQRCHALKSPLGARHAAMLALAYGCGMRRSEVVRITMETLELGASPAVTVIGKGNVERTIPLPEGTVRAVKAWLEHRGRAPGFLLCAVRTRRRGAHSFDVSRPLHGSTMYDMIRRLSLRARVPRFSPHDLRRTFCGDLLDAGVDLSVAKDLMGHASPVTTARYDRRGPRARAEAIARIRVPVV